MTRSLEYVFASRGYTTYFSSGGYRVWVDETGRDFVTIRERGGRFDLGQIIGGREILLAESVDGRALVAMIRAKL